MKLYDGGRAPNPRRVRIFFAEKGLPLPELVPVDIGKKEHRTPEFTRINPSQRLPVLLLEDGTALAETIAICRYIESLHPAPALFGAAPKEAALIEMWNRRIELGLFTAVAAVFRHSHPAMAELEEQVPEWAEANRELIDDHLVLLDLQLGANRFVCGDELTVADITAGIAIDFMKPSRIPLPEDFANIRRWHGELSGPAELEGLIMRLLAALLALMLPLAAAAAEKLTGEQINRAFTGNTVSGRYTGGGFFTEYHDPDGRALGNNGWQENRDACWITKGDAVCYYYGPPEERTTHCFTVELTDRLYILRNLDNGRINAVATIELANPRNHSDGGKPWYCDGLISRGPQAPMSRRVASR